MSGGLYGADIEALRLLADRIDEGSSSLDGVMATVTAALPGTEDWNGPDAELFRSEWDQHHVVRLHESATALAGAAARARDNADAQESTSDGGADGTGGGPPVTSGGPGSSAPAATTPGGTPPGNTPEGGIQPVAHVVDQGGAARDGAGQETADDAPGDSAADEYPPPEVERTEQAEAPGARTPFAETEDLEPNTAYEVEGRGTFYTDADGRVTHVEAEYGGTGDLNYDLIEPQPDTTYVIGDEHVFITDDQGRTVEAHATDLAFGEADRSESIQQRIGDEGGDGYDGGHLIANQFGGGPEDINLVPMLEEVNRGSGDTFYATEMRLREALEGDPPADVEFHVYPEYTGESTVPSTITVDYAIDGEAERKEFDND